MHKRSLLIAVVFFVSFLLAGCPNKPTATFSLGGSISGLSSGSVSLYIQTRVIDVPTQLTTNGPFTVLKDLADGTPYKVSVLTQPKGLNCTVENSVGSLAGADVTNINVTCNPYAYVLNFYGSNISMFAVNNGGVLSALSTPTVTT